MRSQSAALVTLFVALGVLGLKVAAYALTGSLAILSDAAESLVNVAAAVSVIYAVRHARRPPDYQHPYGHAKAEYLSGMLEGSMVLVAAGLIIATAVQHLFDPPALTDVVAGVAVALLAAAANGVTALTLARIGKRQESPALSANARHLRTDMWTSLGVVLAVLLVSATGLNVLDPLVALVVGLHIVREGWQLLTASLSSLLDERLPETEEREMLDALHGDDRILGFHRLRSRRSGFRRFVELDIFVAPQLTVVEGHEIASRLTEELSRRLPNLTATIHVEPFVPGERDSSITPREEYER